MTERRIYDLFISYVDSDSAWVEGYLVDALTQAGVRCHTETAFALGVPRLREFERAIQQSHRVLLIISPAYFVDGFTEFFDLLGQSYGVETSVWPVIPLILHPVVLPPRLTMLTGLDATDEAYWPGIIERLCASLQLPIPGLPPRIPCPYPGMIPFRSEDTRFFYGRDTEIRQMLRHLRHQHLLFVVGPSGSGKSSLIDAGLLPRLNDGSIFPVGFWLVHSMRPGSQPFYQLSTLLGDDITCHKQNIETLISTNSSTRRLLLIIDQFEELFTQSEPDEQRLFVASLNTLRKLESCSLLIAMRADFYPDLMSSDLWPVSSSHRLEVAPLRGAALRQAIQQPAEDIGVFLEAGLLERLLADAAHEPGVLPLVQETMVLLWGEMRRRLLSLSAYEQLGTSGYSGLAVAVATKANAVLSELSETQQRIARRIFLRLVQFGEGREETRRQQPSAALRSIDDNPSLFEQTLRQLADNRLLTLTGDDGADSVKVDIAHEELIRGWPTLRQWIAEWIVSEQERRRLETKAAEWVRMGRGRGGLLDEIELPEAERWLASSDGTDMGYSQELAALVQTSRDYVIKQMKQESERHQKTTLKEMEPNISSHSNWWTRLRYRPWIYWPVVIFTVLAAIISTLSGILGASTDLSGARQQLVTWGILPDFPIEANGETLIIIADFYNTQGARDVGAENEIRRTILQVASEANIANLRIEISSSRLRADDRQGAEALGKRYNATIVIWGEDTGVRVIAHFLDLRESDFKAADISIIETQYTQLSDPSGYVHFITQDMPRQLAFLSLFAIGQSEYAKGNYSLTTQIIEKAIITLDRLSESPQSLAQAYFILGSARSQEGNLPEALNDLSQTIKLDPQDFNAYYKRGIVYKDLGMKDKAISDLQYILNKASDPSIRQLAQKTLNELGGN